MNETLTASRELDALVAERVIGFTVESFQYPYGGEGPELASAQVWKKDGVTFNPLPYSTDIAAAWAVVEKLNERFGNYWALVRRGDEWVVFDNPHDIGDYPPVVEASTAPLAICLAALKDVGYDR